MQPIDSPADIANGAQYLAEADPDMAAILSSLDEIPLRRRPAGFATLLEIIVGQQVSTKAASAISARLREAGLTSATAVNACAADDLLACGLSRPKARYAQGIASSGLDWDGLAELSDAATLDALVSLPGVGRWTAEVYMLTALGRADVFPAGDLALQEAWRMASVAPDRLSEPAFRERAKIWAPWRAVAARALWSYYRLMKNREGLA